MHNYIKLLILIIILYIFIIQEILKNNANISNNNYGNIIDRMVVLYLYCEGDREKFKKLKQKYYNEEIYTDDIFLFNFDYKFKISLFDKIKLFSLFYMFTASLWRIFNIDAKKHMHKYVGFVIDNYIKQNKVIEDDNIKNTICIHFRCSDSPFNRHTTYQLVTLDFYKEAIKYALTKHKFNKIILLSCNTHKGDGNNLISDKQSTINQNMCSNFIDEYINGLKEFNIDIEVKCGNISQDFYYLKNAGCSIATAGSFALYGSYGSNNLLILSENLKNNNFRDNIVIIKNKIIKHKDVKDYYDLTEMKNHINKI